MSLEQGSHRPCWLILSLSCYRRKPFVLALSSEETKQNKNLATLHTSLSSVSSLDGGGGHGGLGYWRIIDLLSHILEEVNVELKDISGSTNT